MNLYSNKLLTLSIALSLTFASGCADNHQVSQNAPPVVKTLKVEISQTDQENIFSGVVCSRYETNLAFQVSGRILSRSVQVGSSVHSGDILMTIDNRDVLQHSNQGEAQVAAAKAQLDLSKSNLSRYTQLYKDDAIPASMLEQYQTEYNSAQANYDNAVAQAKQLENELAYTNLTANADGVISAVNAEEGQVVSAGQTVMTLSQTDELEIAIDIPESKISEIELRQPVEVKFWAIDDTTEGFVREIAPIANASSRTFAVKISVPNPPEKMKLGMTASVNALSGEHVANKITIPLSAVYQVGDKNQVWVIDEGKAKLRNIEIKDFDGNDIWVSGLKNGDIIITAGIHKLTEGQIVRSN